MRSETCIDDDALLSFVGRALDAAKRDAITAHLDTCPECRLLVADFAREEATSHAPPGPDGDVGDRYVLLSTLGAGTMGVVQAAFDRQLDRKVALKFLSSAPGEDAARARARLQREAQALAKLAHPNVVTVHDVGVLDGEVYVSMELVEGATLRAWLASSPRAQSEVLSILRQAGEGLAAAHAAGLVHRDFKPDNVLVGDDGRARVTDFGLARSAPGEDADGATNDAGDARTATLTQTGVRAGTPAYMSPEMKAGDAPSARSDVYAFCVTLHEAVTGARPGSPTRRRPPAWLERAITRGLRARPEDRWPSMRALLDVLARGPTFTPGRVLGLVAFVAVVSSAGLVEARRAAKPAPPPCPAPEHAFDGVWDDARRAAVESALGAAGRAEAQTYVARRLDDDRAAWMRAAVDTCEATRVRGQQSERLLDLRMACLDDRRSSIERAVALLAAGDSAVAARSVEIVSGLPGVEGCARASTLQETVVPPAGADATVEAAKLALDDARSLFLAGKTADAHARIAPAVADMTKIGYPPLLAQLLYWRGRIEYDLEDSAASERTLAEAGAQAIEARDDATLARAWTRYGFLQRRKPNARVWLDDAAAAIRRLGGDDELEGERLLSLGSVAEDRSEARAALLRARELLVRTRGQDYYLVADCDQLLGNVALDDGDIDSAKRYHASALALRRRLFGLDHASTVSSTFNVAEDAIDEERPAEARESLRELGAGMATRPVMERAWYELKLGDIATLEHDHAAAFAHYQACDAIYEAANPDDPLRAFPLLGEGRALMELRRPRDAIAPLETAVALRAPMGEAAAADQRFDLGRAMYAAGDAARGRALVERAQKAYVAHPDETVSEMRDQAKAWLAAHR